ncbi:hypothetical protein ACWATR_37815 [Nostoc sp. UIC 10890]
MTLLLALLNLEMKLSVNQKVFLQIAIAEFYVTYNTYEYRVL